MPKNNGTGSGFGCGSGSFYFRHWSSRDHQKTNFFITFSAYYFLKVHLHHFSKMKSPKKSQNSRNQGFSYYFCLMIEGSGGPKNMWSRWIRIRNTGFRNFLAVGSPLPEWAAEAVWRGRGCGGWGSASPQERRSYALPYRSSSPGWCPGYLKISSS